MKSYLIAAMAMAGSPTSYSDISLVEGAYGGDHAARWYFTPRSIPGGRELLQFTDIGDGDVRLLMQEEGMFVGGPELAEFQPQSVTARFDGEVVEICEDARCVVARRMPLREQEITFESRGATLRGTIWLPLGPGPHPAVILAVGSEDNDRRSLDPIPQVLASHGFVVLSYDKRGTGESEGDWESQGIEELAADLRTAFEEVLLPHPAVRPEAAGVVGLSEGPWTSVEAYRQGAPFQFLVALSGGAETKGESYLDKERARLRERDLTDEQIAAAMSEHRAMIADAVRRVQEADEPSGFDKRVAYDPLDAWRMIDIPVLWVAGEWDVLQNQVRGAEWMRDVLAQSRTDDRTVVLLPGTNHALFEAPSDMPSDWQRMRGVTRYSPGFWPLLLQWLEERVR